MVKKNGDHTPVICLMTPIQNLKKELEYYFNELHALEKMLYETDMLDNDIVEVDCLGKKKV